MDCPVVSGALLLLFVVACWYWITGSLGVLPIHDVANITIGWTEVCILVKPLQVFVFFSLFFAHVRHPSGNEQGQTGCRHRTSQVARLAD